MVLHLGAGMDFQLREIVSQKVIYSPILDNYRSNGGVRKNGKQFNKTGQLLVFNNGI